jgi:hypothetical protein
VISWATGRQFSSINPRVSSQALAPSLIGLTVLSGKLEGHAQFFFYYMIKEPISNLARPCPQSIRSNCCQRKARRLRIIFFLL